MTDNTTDNVEFINTQSFEEFITERNKKLIDDARKNMRIKDLSRKYKIGHSTLYYILKKHLPKEEYYRLASESRTKERERHREVIKLFREGKSISDIQTIYPQLTEVNVYKILNKTNEIRKRKEKRNEEMWRKYNEGMTINALADEYTISRNTVSEVISRKRDENRNKEKD